MLTEIKEDDGLTFRDLGRVLGKGVDQAERIAKGMSVMDMPTFLAACDYWGERFADRVMALAHLKTAPCEGMSRADQRGSRLLARLLDPIMAAEEDGVEEAEELRPHEDLIRAVHRRSGDWLETIAAAPSLKAVR